MTPEQHAALKAGRDLLASYIDEGGGCDHSTGICDEPDRLVLARMDAALAAPQCVALVERITRMTPAGVSAEDDADTLNSLIGRACEIFGVEPMRADEYDA